MKIRGKKPDKKRSLLAVLLFFALLALLLSTTGVTLAKYVSQRHSSGAAVAKPFYFSSDKLAEDTPYYQIDEPAEGETVEVAFTLSNFVDRLRRTDTSIHYTYRAEDASGAVVPGTQGEGDLAAGDFETTPQIVLELGHAAFGDGGAVTVVAESTSPYQTVISAKFGFVPVQEQLQVSVGEQGDAVVMELAGGDGGNVTVSWPDSLSPDLSNTVFEGAVPGSVTFAAKSGARYALTFFKSDPAAEYTAADFQITHS